MNFGEDLNTWFWNGSTLRKFQLLFRVQGLLKTLYLKWSRIATVDWKYCFQSWKPSTLFSSYLNIFSQWNLETSKTVKLCAIFNGKVWKMVLALRLIYLLMRTWSTKIWNDVCFKVWYWIKIHLES